MVEDTARALAEELIKSEFGQAFIVAKKAYDEDFEAQSLLTDYIKKENEFQKKLAEGNVSDEEKEAYYDEMNKLNVQIKGSGASGALYKAETEFNEFTQSIFNIIMTAVQNALVPEQDGGCGGSCGSCSGCH